MRVKGWVVNPKNIIGHPDIAFPDKKIAIFVDGCFWHGCPYCNRTLPKTNKDYWVQKISKNLRRDQEVTGALVNEGWKVIRIWEHNLRKHGEFRLIVKEIRDSLKISDEYR
jgi:DNA mismatch endonuclease (patch repair protein)